MRLSLHVPEDSVGRPSRKAKAGRQREDTISAVRKDKVQIGDIVDLMLVREDLLQITDAPHAISC